MRICFFADARNIHVQRVTVELAKRGHRVHLVCHKPLCLAHVTVERFHVPEPSFAYPYRWNRRWAHYLGGFLRRFDVVILFFLHDWGFTPEITKRGCFVVAPQGSDIVPPPGEGKPTPELVEKRIALLRAANCVGVAGPSFARVVARFAGLDLEAIAPLPLGVDLERFRPDLRSKPGRAYDARDHPIGGQGPPHESSADRLHAAQGKPAPRVGFFKGFRPVYGAADWIRGMSGVLKQLPDVRFDLVGDGPQLTVCRALAAQLGVQGSITWIPHQPHDCIPRLLSRWDISVQPSICESFGLAALEALAMEVPVVATRVGSLPDLVRDGETGVLVPPESPDRLAEAVVSLLLDDTRRRRMGRAAREWVRQHYEWHDVVRQWEDTLQRALEGASMPVLGSR